MVTLSLKFLKSLFNIFFVFYIINNKKPMQSNVKMATLVANQAAKGQCRFYNFYIGKFNV